MAGKEKTADTKRKKRRVPPAAQAPETAGGGKPRAVPRKRRRRRRHGRMTLNYLLFGVLGFIILMLLCYFVFFKVYKITVTGETGSYSESEIVAASKIEMRDSLFSVDQKTVYANVVNALPYVQTVVVHKKFPTTVELEIALSRPVGVVEKDNQYLYINTDGRILESGLMSYNRDYPVILGITPSSTEEGSYVLNQNSEQIVMLKRVLAAVETSGLEKINLISVADRLNIRIMYDERLLVELGTEADLDWKLQFIRSSIENNISSTAKAVLDASLLDEIGRVFYREERDLYALLEQDVQQAESSGGETPEGTAQGEGASSGSASSEGPKFQVDPQTGDIIVGLQDPLNPNASSSSAPEQGSSSEAASSSSSAASSSITGGSGAQSSSSPSEAAGSSSSSGSAAASSSASSKPVIGPAAPKRSSRSSSSEASSSSDGTQ